MKRSEVNQILRETKEFLAAHQFVLPPFANWSPADWRARGTEADEIRDNCLGWDITDFGAGDFQHLGLTLFTIRNGNYQDARYTKPYAEKIMVVAENQVTPMHFHALKMEDIINRGGGNLLIELYNATDTDELAKTPVTVSVDGVRRTIAPGEILRLTPGESITMTPRLYHKFYGEPGKGRVLVGEVSRVNDDRTDNRFYEQTGRFPAIEEDEQPLHLLCNEYPRP
ncbi:MAG TPA: D-lyxose/D-mannose family sugar isomerase [Armatimonadota bacterium]|nr:D-lyxose/D-mannose family sugar isomerase [Armatimonadota bacterium]